MARKQYNKDSYNIYRGIVPFIDNDPSHKEFYEVGLDYDQVSKSEKKYPLQEPTPFPPSDKDNKFKNFVNNHYQTMQNLSLKIMSYLAEGLGLELDFFDKWFEKDSLSTFRMIHYLPRSSGVVKNDQLTEEDMKFTTMEHQDSTVLTLLSTFNYPGLQVKVGEEYKSIRPQKNTLIVNLGVLFSRMTNFKLKATLHRVLDI